MIENKALKELLQNALDERDCTTHEASISEIPSDIDLAKANEILLKNGVTDYYFRCFYCETCKEHYPDSPYHLELYWRYETEY